MAGSDITIRTGDGTPFQAYLAGDTPSRPAVIMFTPIFGVDADAKAIADRWADRGYLVAVPDYYFRQAPGVLDRSESGRKSAMERWMALNVDRAVSDMRGLASHAHLEGGSDLAAALACRNRRNHPFAKIKRIRSGHPMLASIPASILNQNPPDLGILRVL
jgi:carboxymethylenebutenolidase